MIIGLILNWLHVARSWLLIINPPSPQKAITGLALPDVAVEGKGGELLLTATDKKNKTSNNVSIVLGKTDKITPEKKWYIIPP